MSADHAPTPPPERPRRRVSPWWIILGGTLFAMLLFGGFAGLAIALREEPQPSLGIASAPMPDGTLLVLEDITFGTHTFEIELPPSPGFSLFPTRRIESVTAYGGMNGYAIWLSRRDGQRPDRYLDFEWWGRCVVVDENGWEVEDDNPGLRGYGNNGSTGTSGSRPLSVNASGTRYERIIAHSSLPRVRHAGSTFRLKVYNLDNELVAELDVPDPAPPGPIPEWTPSRLPATADDGNVTLQLNNVTSQVYSWQRDHGVQENVQINVATEFFQDGQSSDEWYVQYTTFSDALGNEAQSYGFRLSPFEPAWKLNVRAMRNKDAPFSEKEKWTASPLDLPAADTGVLVSESATVGSTLATVDVAAIGGPGTVKYSGLGGIRTSSSYGGMAGSETFNINHDAPYAYSGSSAAPTSQVVCNLPHLVLKVDGLTNNQNLTLIAVDDQGRDVKTHGPYQISEMHFFFLEPAEDAKSVTPIVVVQDGRNFEFLIKPPEIIRPSKRLPESEVIEQVAQLGATPLLYTSLRTDNGELMLAVPGETTLQNLSNNPAKDCAGSWSPDGSQIVLESERGGQHHLWIINADGSDARQLTSSPYADYSPAWSPTGDRICFRRTTNDPNQNWELFLINPDGTGETNITNHPANDADPTWSPDGQRIAFTSTREESWWVYSMQVDGSDVQLLSRTSNGYVYPAWSPDGSTIAFTGWVDGHHEIFLVDADGQNERQLTDLNGESSHAAWSPDGSLVCFEHRRDSFPWGMGSIYSIRADGSDLQEIIPIEAFLDGGRPAWRPQ